jgi:16S rRNA (cytosine967-C5)-methyltransferase
MRPALVRLLAVDVAARVLEGRELADRALHRAVRAHPELHSTERRRVGEAAFAMIRFARRHGYVLERVVRDWARRSSPERLRLRFAAALLEVLKDDLASVALAAGLSGPEKAALSALPGWGEWPADPVERLGVTRSVPDWFAGRILQQFQGDADALAAALNERAPLVLRANGLQATREELLRRLGKEGVSGRAEPLSPWALTLDERPNVLGLAAFKEGLAEMQDAGSQLIALATGARAGETVIDACAGGGGKTLALAAMMRNKGRLVACDVTAARLEDLKPRARRAGAFNLEPRVIPADSAGEAALRALGGRADVVLVDAPCSGTGAWRRNPDARWRMTAAEVEAFPALQLGVLERYAATAKPGGRVVYATCSVLAAENEEVVAAFLRRHPEFESAPIQGLPAEVLDAAGRLTTLPHRHGTDGFFAAMLVRRGR